MGAASRGRRALLRSATTSTGAALVSQFRGVAFRYFRPLGLRDLRPGGALASDCKIVGDGRERMFDMMSSEAPADSRP